jgi:trehalose 6-phosphate phosphatase
LITENVRIALDRCLAVLEARPAGLLTDIDGTISLIAPTPNAAFVADDALAALRALAERLEVVGVITGRSAANAEQMLAIPGILYIGNHGLEHRRHGDTDFAPGALYAADAISAALDQVRRGAEAVALIDGILYENKGVTASIHYRLASDQDAARDRLIVLARSAAAQHRLRVSEGRMVIELRPEIAVHKGTALRSVVERFDLRGLVFFGDDITDIDGFAALTALRDAGVVRGVNVAVTAPESLPEVAAAADVSINGVACCVELLGELANRLAGRSRE